MSFQDSIQIFLFENVPSLMTVIPPSSVFTVISPSANEPPLIVRVGNSLFTPGTYPEVGLEAA